MAVNNTPYATRLCLSGVESRRLLDTFKDFGVKHIQVSYYYLRRVFADPLEFEKYTKDFHTVIIDSGTVYGNIKNEDQKNELLRDYARFLSSLSKHAYSAAVYEAGHSIDTIVPDEALIYPLDDIRDVYDNDLGALFRNTKYVGISNKECMAKGGEDLVPIFAQASKHGAYLHAFGTSSRKILSKFAFYSANSSSWRSGSRYLNTYIYEGPGRGLRIYQPTDKKDTVKTEKETKAIRRRQSNLVKVRHPEIYPKINWEEAYEGDSWEVDKGNLAQWMLYQGDLENMPHNKYFLSESERAQINMRKKDLIDANRLDHSSHSNSNDANAPDQNAEPTDRNDEAEDPELGTALHQSEFSPVIEGEAVSLEEADSQDVENRESAPSVEIALQPDTQDSRLTPVDERMRYTRNCDFCILAGRCPKYEPGAPCSFGLPPENPTYQVSKLEQHIMEDAADLLAIQKDRVMQGYLEEKMDASGLSKDVNREIKTYLELVQLLSEATDKRDEVSIKAKGTGVLEMFAKKKS